MNLPHLSEAALAQYAAPHIIERGREYYEQGRVISLILRGTTLSAEVEGSEEFPYLVRYVFEADGSIEVSCTCPYDWGGWCKHLVAVYLALIHQPNAIEERPPLERLLADLTREQLQAVVLKLAEHDPSLVETVERTLDLLRPVVVQTATQTQANISPSTRRVVIDPKAVRRQVRSAIHSLDRMRSSEAYWHVGAAVGEVRHLLDQVMTLIHTDQGRDALPVLEAITETYLDEWTTFDDSDGEASGFFFDLGPAWTEALLSADLDHEERRAWADRLNEWQEDLSDYGVDDAFECAATAALQGWDYPPLQRVLHGEITRQGAWQGEPPPYADDLTRARLSLLERRGRFQEYLFLAEAEGQDVAYTTMLVRLNRVQEAMDYGLRGLGTPQDALALATALSEHGEREHSLRIAEHGLALEGPKAPLATWLREQAITLNRRELALTAAEYAFCAEITLDNYLRVADLAGEQWPERRLKLLASARSTRSLSAEGRVTVFLHEKLFDDAIAALEPYASHELIARVADAVLTERPEWVIQISRQQAASIMDSGKAQYYHSAANWLKKAREAYRVLNRETEWRVYLSELLRKHGRKYKLVPLLEALR